MPTKLAQCPPLRYRLTTVVHSGPSDYPTTLQLNKLGTHKCRRRFIRFAKYRLQTNLCQNSFGQNRPFRHYRKAAFALSIYMALLLNKR